MRYAVKKRDLVAGDRHAFFSVRRGALHLAFTVRRLRKGDADVIIFDRYIYDELANLPLNRWIARVFVRLVSALVPKPDVAYVIDADPAAAFARKPEYPLEFVRNNRRNLSNLEPADSRRDHR